MSRPITLIYGGSFDPPHVMHGRMASVAADSIGATTIVIIPTGVNPQRTQAPPSPAVHRLAMVRLAFANESRAVIDDRETLREGKSYTVDTLEELARERPNETLRLLLGGDQALNFQSWRNPERIIELAEPVVVPRPPMDAAALMNALEKRYGVHAHAWIGRVLKVAPVDLSSTSLRATLAQGVHPEPAAILPSVAAYALQHKLYQPLA